MRLCRLCKRLYPGEQAICPDGATNTVETTLEPLPEELRARFPESEPLALGATGTLYLVDRPGGTEAQLGTKLVLKVLANELTQDASERARHRRDLRKQQALVHPQLPRVIEEGESDGRVWFTRDFVPATSLAVRLHKHGAFEPVAALELIVQLAAALDGLHQLGLVHRDLKPGHVLLRPAQNGAPGRVALQLIDATFAAPLTAGNPARRGTADYAAVEIVEGAAATVRTDLYALGCLSYELFTGVAPFRGASAAADGEPDTEATLAAQRGAEAKELPGNVPQPVRSLISSLLSKDAHRRPFSAQQVRRAIEPILSPTKPAARSDSRSVLQREAAALRLTGPTAKPVTPRNVPDATLELDVEDLEEAIQASDAQQENEARPSAGDKAKADDDSAPTIALSTSQVPTLAAQPTAAASQVTATHSSDKSATISASASAREPTAPGLAPQAPLSATTNGTSAERTAAGLASEAPLDAQTTRAARESSGAATSANAGTTSSAASDAQRTAAAASFDNASAPSAAARVENAAGVGEAGADNAPRRTRTGTKFGLGPVRTEDIEAAAAAAAQLSAADAAAPSAVQPPNAAPPADGATTGAQPSAAIVGPPSAEPSASDAAASGAQPSASVVGVPGAQPPLSDAAASGAQPSASVVGVPGAQPPLSDAAASGAQPSASVVGVPGAQAPLSDAAAPSTQRLASDAAGTQRLASDAAGAQRLASDAAGTQRLAPDAAGAQRLASDAAGTQRLASDAAGAQLSAADAAAVASAGTQAESEERKAYPAVREAQPAPAQSMERSAYPALRESHAAAQPAVDSVAPRTRPKRYSASPKALMQSPRLLLWAAAALVLLISGVRLAFGPAEATRSPSVVVRVPEVTTEVPAPKQVVAELSEQALIGGDIKRVKLAPLAAAVAEQPGAADESARAEATESEALDDDAPADAKSIRTVSAGSVRGALARAAANRQPAADSGKTQSPADLKAKGRELYQAGKYREAADAYQRATQRNSSDAAAYAGLGGSLLATGDTRKAITAYQRAVHLEPEVSGFQAALGRAYLKKGDRAKARAAYSKALKLDPNNQAARTGMANAKAR